MPRLVALNIAVTIDGYSAGPDQSLENPLGVNGTEMMEPFFHTRTFQTMHGTGDGETGVDDGFAARSFVNIGAWILGRNMFGPVRGPWPDESWRGWWGEDPPYHVPTFVLTHHARRPLPMKGGTEFRFVTDGIHSALRQAMEAAGGKDVRVGGGVSTLRQYLRLALIDELHLMQAPALFGRGESLFEGLDLRALGYHCAERVTGERAVHIILRKRG